MNLIETMEFYKEQVKEHMNADGLFPDSILGDDIWPLTYCRKHWINGELWWSFVN